MKGPEACPSAAKAGLIILSALYGTPVIAFLTLELHIEGAHSLKDKRRVLRSMKDKLRSKVNVSVAELAGAEISDSFVEFL